MIKGLADYEQCECKLCNHDKAILVVYFNIIFNYNLLTYSLKKIKTNMYINKFQYEYVNKLRISGVF